MLLSLAIENFAIIDSLTTDWQKGFTVITGETGAGKSIAIDALTFCLGARADAKKVRNGQSRADISATFDISNLPLAQTYLAEHALDTDDGECVLRRSMTNKGRSQAFINGKSVTLKQLQQIGEHLVAIHGQHAHQTLGRSDNQRTIVDAFGQLQSSVKAVSDAYQTLITAEQMLEQTRQAQADNDAKKQLLAYQVEEFNDFAPVDGEYEDIEREHSRLANGQTLLEDCHRVTDLLGDGDTTVLSALGTVLSSMTDICNTDNSLQGTLDALYDCQTVLEEQAQEVRRYQDRIELDPARLQEVETRMEQYLTLARKHGIKPDAVYAHAEALQQEWDGLQESEAALPALEEAVTAARASYQAQAHALTTARQTAAGQFSEQITAQLSQLNMGGQFEIAVRDHERGPSPYGNDNIDFLLSSNRGQPLHPLSDVASGGELSRISLAIQVILASRVTTPTLIFDEVDVGISGPTAAIVGKLLRKLGAHHQVVSITHLPQVASCGEHHYYVNKHDDNDMTCTQMTPLEHTSRVDEVARLLGGTTITHKTRENATELIIQGSHV
jgi:DNA repair protein RecN (Recombination protein N)